MTAATPERFGRLVGSTVTEVEAKGKHLLIHFDKGQVLHSHMRMTGSWHIYMPGEPWRKPGWAARVVLGNDDAVAVLFNAPAVELKRERVLDHELAHLGPDILAPELDVEAIIKRARGSERQALGELLLDQRVAADIGNIYECESLWRLKLDPWMLATVLDDEALAGLYRAALSLPSVEDVDARCGGLT